MDRRALWRHATRTLSATYLSRALCAVRGFINARYLGPEWYGFWSGLMMLTSFAHHLHGGTRDAMARQIPFERSRLGAKGAGQTAQVVWTFFSAVLVVAALGVWAIALTLPEETPVLVRLAWWVTGAAMVLEVWLAFEEVVTRAEERFEHLNRSLFLAGLASLGMTAWWVPAYPLPGLYATALLTPAVGLIYLRRHAGYRWRFIWDVARFRSMLQTGWPILAMTLVFEALWWVDRLLVLGVLNATAFGYYSLGTMLMRLGLLFPEVVASVVEPRLYFDYAKHGKAEHVWEHLWLPLRTLSLLLPVGLAAADLAIPAFVRWWLPAYAPALGAIRLLVWGTFFMGIMVCTKSFIVALGLQRRMLRFYVGAIAVNLTLSLLLLQRGWGLTGVALGTVAAYGFCSTALLAFSFRRLEASVPAAAWRVLSLYLPVALMGGLAVLVPVLTQWFGLCLSDGWLLLTRGSVIAAFSAAAWIWVKRSLPEVAAP